MADEFADITFGSTPAPEQTLITPPGGFRSNPEEAASLFADTLSLGENQFGLDKPTGDVAIGASNEPLIDPDVASSWAKNEAAAFWQDDENDGPDDTFKRIATNPNLPVAERLNAVRAYENEAASGLFDAAEKPQQYFQAMDGLARDATKARVALWRQHSRQRVKELFPNIDERRNFFSNVSQFGYDDIGAYPDGPQQDAIQTLNKEYHDMMADTTRTIRGGRVMNTDNTTVANYTVQKTPDNQAMVSLLFPKKMDDQAQAKSMDDLFERAKVRMPYPDAANIASRVADLEKQHHDALVYARIARSPVSAADISPSGTGEAEALAYEQDASRLQQQINILKAGGQRAGDLALDLDIADKIKGDESLSSRIASGGFLGGAERSAKNLVIDTAATVESVPFLGAAMNWMSGQERGSIVKSGAETKQSVAEGTLGSQGRRFEGGMLNDILVGIEDNIAQIGAQVGSVFLAGGAARVLGMTQPSVLAARMFSFAPIANVFGNSQIEVERRAQVAEARGDLEGAKKLRDAAFSYSATNTAVEFLSEMIFPDSQARVGMSFMRGFRHARMDILKEAAEEPIAGIGQDLLANPLIGEYNHPLDPQKRFTEFATGVAMFSFQIPVQRLANRMMYGSEDEQIRRSLTAEQKKQADILAHIQDATSPAPVNTSDQMLPVASEDGSTRLVLNPSYVSKNDATGKWTIADPEWNQRAKASGMTTEFDTEEEAAATSRSRYQLHYEHEIKQLLQGGDTEKAAAALMGTNMIFQAALAGNGAFTAEDVFHNVLVRPTPVNRSEAPSAQVERPRPRRRPSRRNQSRSRTRSRRAPWGRKPEEVVSQHDVELAPPASTPIPSEQESHQQNASSQEQEAKASLAADQGRQEQRAEEGSRVQYPAPRIEVTPDATQSAGAKASNLFEAVKAAIDSNEWMRRAFKATGFRMSIVSGNEFEAKTGKKNAFAVTFAQDGKPVIMINASAHFGESAAMTTGHEIVHAADITYSQTGEGKILFEQIVEDLETGTEPWVAELNDLMRGEYGTRWDSMDGVTKARESIRAIILGRLTGKTGNRNLKGSSLLDYLHGFFDWIMRTLGGDAPESSLKTYIHNLEQFIQDAEGETPTASGATSPLYEDAPSSTGVATIADTTGELVSSDQIFVAHLSAATGTIPGIDKLTKEAVAGDESAARLVNDIARDAIDHLIGGIPSVRITYSPAIGMYGGSLEPSLGLEVGFDLAHRDQVLAGLAKFASNYNQEQIHVLQSDGGVSGETHDDGSYNTLVVAWKRGEYSHNDLHRIASEAGLFGFTVADDRVEAYFVGDPSNADEIKTFEQAANRASKSLERLKQAVSRLWVYGNGAIPYSSIEGAVSPQAAGSSNTARRIAARLAGREVTPVNPAARVTKQQAELQTRISDAYEAMRLNALDDPMVRRAYTELADELLEQFDALPVKVEILSGQGEPYKSSKEMRNDVLTNNHLFIFGTDAATFGPEGIVYNDHPLLRDSGRLDINGRPMLYNDLLRAVHDYYAHTMTEAQFGALGEEAAWANHMEMTRSPWARLALTSETRGQNSYVNFGPNAEHNKTNKENTIFAPQKVDLLPVEFAKTGNPELDAQMDQVGSLIQNSLDQQKASDRMLYEDEPNTKPRYAGEDAGTKAAILAAERLSQVASAIQSDPSAGDGTVEGARKVAEIAQNIGVPIVAHDPSAWLDDVQEIRGGREHKVWVYRDRETGGQRVIKALKSVNMGLNTDEGGGLSMTKADYLTRFLLGNLIFGDDARLEGVTSTGRMFISQPFYVGSKPTGMNIMRGMTSLGLVQLYPGTTDYHNWKTPDGSLVLADVHRDNAILLNDGRLMPIDVAFFSAAQDAWIEDRRAYEKANGTDDPMSLTEFVGMAESLDDLGMSATVNKTLTDEGGRFYYEEEPAKESQRGTSASISGARKGQGKGRGQGTPPPQEGAVKNWVGRKIQLTHWGKYEIKRTDPKFHGTGGMGKERDRSIYSNYRPRTFFAYGRYRREHMIGNNRHVTIVDGGLIYDYKRDPLNLFPSSDEMRAMGHAPYDMRASVNVYENRIVDAGYLGYASRDFHVVALFKPMSVRKVRDSDVPAPHYGPYFYEDTPITPQQDAEYLAAVKAGDMETAQRMVDEAAKRAGYGGAAFLTTTDEEKWSEQKREINRKIRIHQGNVDRANASLLNPKIDPALRKVAESSKTRNLRAWHELKLALDAGIPPKTIFHGTAGRWTIYSRKHDGRSIWGTASRDVAETYGENIYGLYFKMLRPLEVDAKGASFQELTFEGERLDADDLSRIAEDRGYDGLIIRNFFDSNDDSGGGIIADHFAVFSPNQIKSADPVTYDSAGNPIPLSQRFNPLSNSILYEDAPASGNGDESYTDAVQQKSRSAALADIGAVINLGKKADVISLLHEMVHAISVMQAHVDPRDTSKGTRSLLELIAGPRFVDLHLFATKDGDIDPSSAPGHRWYLERLAEGFERWLMEGELPAGADPKLLQAFKDIREAMARIIKAMRDSNAIYGLTVGGDEDITPEVLTSYQTLMARIDESRSLDGFVPFSHSVVQAAREMHNAALLALAANGETPRLYQNRSEALAFIEAAPLITIATSHLITVFNSKAPKTIEEFRASIAAIPNHPLNGVNDGQLSLILDAALVAIPGQKEAEIRNRILGNNGGILSLPPANIEEYRNEVLDALNSAIDTEPDAAARKGMKAIREQVREANTKDRLDIATQRAARAVGRASGDNARRSNAKLRTLMAGWRAGRKDTTISKIADEVRTAFGQQIKARGIRSSTRNLVNQVLNGAKLAEKGQLNPVDYLLIVEHAAQLLEADTAKASVAAFASGLKSGVKLTKDEVKIRAGMLLDLIKQEIKGVDGASKKLLMSVAKSLPKLTTDAQLSRAAGMIQRAFAGQRRLEAYRNAKRGAANVKRNLRKGMFGAASELFMELASVATHHIPDHLLPDYLALTGYLGSSAKAILVNDAVVTSAKDWVAQFQTHLLANPPNVVTRSAATVAALAAKEAVAKANALNEFAAAAVAVDRDAFVHGQMTKFGRTKDQANAALSVLNQFLDHVLLATPADLDHYTSGGIFGIAGALRNFNEGVAQAHIVKAGHDLATRSLHDQLFPILEQAVRHVLGAQAGGSLKDITADEWDRRATSIADSLLMLSAGGRLTSKQLQKKLHAAGLYHFDSLLGTVGALNEMIVTPLTRLATLGELNRAAILDSRIDLGHHGVGLFYNLVKDHELDSSIGDKLYAAMKRSGLFDVRLWQTNQGALRGVAGAIGAATSAIPGLSRAYIREAISRIIGIAMIQRQREANGWSETVSATGGALEGNYVQWLVSSGDAGNVSGEFARLEAVRQTVAARAILDALNGKAPTWDNIKGLLSPSNLRFIELADKITDSTGQVVYHLNFMDENNPLEMFASYYPIRDMSGRGGKESISSTIARTSLPLPTGASPSGTPVGAQAQSRNRRTDTSLKLIDADAFGVIRSHVGQVTADAAMSPFLNQMNAAMGRVSREGELGGSGSTVVNQINQELLEHGARMAHGIMMDHDVPVAIFSWLKAKMRELPLAAATRPITEAPANFVRAFVSMGEPLIKGMMSYLSNTSFAARVMVGLHAPIAFRTGSASLEMDFNGLNSAVGSALAADFQLPGPLDYISSAWHEADRAPAKAGLWGFVQGNRLARATKSMSHLLTMWGEMMIARPMWWGVFTLSLERQSGAAFSEQSYSSGAYSKDQIDRAVAEAENAVSRKFAESAKGTQPNKGQEPLMSQEDGAASFARFINYAFTSYMGAQMRDFFASLKGLIGNNGSQYDRRQAIAGMTSIVAANVVNAVMVSSVYQLLSAALPSGNPEDDRRRKRRMQEYFQSMTGGNGLGDAVAFWSKMVLRGAFGAAFGGRTFATRLGLAAVLEGLNYKLGNHVTWSGAYDPFKDNITFEVPSSVSSFLVGHLNGDKDWRLRGDQDLYATSILSAHQFLGLATIMAERGVSMWRSAANIYDRRVKGDEIDDSYSIQNLAAMGLFALNALPIAATVLNSIGPAEAASNPAYATREKKKDERAADKLARQFVESGDPRFRQDAAEQSAEALARFDEQVKKWSMLKAEIGRFEADRDQHAFMESALNTMSRIESDKMPQRFLNLHRQAIALGIGTQFLVSIARLSKAGFSSMPDRGVGSEDFNSIKSQEEAAYNDGISTLRRYYYGAARTVK